MRFVKDGKLYDTDTATQIGAITPMFMGEKAETLFITQKGTPFLLVVSVMGTLSTTVQPISPEKAREWAEKNLDVETVCTFFGVEEA